MSVRYTIQKKDTKTSIYFNPEKLVNLEIENIKLMIEDDNNMDVYPNADVNTYTYENVKRYIYRIIKETKFLCKGLNHEYVSDSFDEVDAVIIIGSQMNILPNGNIYGFALLKFDESKNSIYIDVICSHSGIKGAGDILINEIQKLCRTLLMTEIHLTSVENAISFYEKYGFIKHDIECEDMCLMKKSVKRKKGGKNKKTNKQKYQRKNKKTKKNRVMK